MPHRPSCQDRDKEKEEEGNLQCHIQGKKERIKDRDAERALIDQIAQNKQK